MSWQFEASKITTSAAAKTWLRKTYPEVFASEVVKPLSYSVRSLLQQHADLAGVWRVALDSAMLDIVQSPAYLAACAADGALRVSLNGQAVEPVSLSDRTYAKAMLRRPKAEAATSASFFLSHRADDA
jgi:sRNA-binding protein